MNFFSALAYDYMGTYEIAFYAAGIPPILAAVLMFLIPARKPQVTAVSRFFP